MVVFPNAKINLGLNILRKRADGYHDIESVMLPVPWTDILEIVPACGNADMLTVTGRQIDCPLEKNLVMKTVRALRSIHNFPAVDIHLHKVIPDGAGLGGGSADAAFTITAINSLFKLGLTVKQMVDVAATIGADCPFFIYNRPMLATGIGTTLSDIRLNLPASLWIAIVKPSVSVPTREAYSGVCPYQPESSIKQLIETLPISNWTGRLINDFENSVFKAYPDILDIKQQLLDLGAIYASMSGSGSAVYGLFDRDIMADRTKLLDGYDCYIFKELTIC